MTFTRAQFLDVAEGLQPNQFTVGDRDEMTTLAELEPSYRQLLDDPVVAVLAVIAGDGRPSLTPVWFDYEGDTVLLNFAAHRKKTEWVRRTPQVSMLLLNPDNPYHWVSIKATATNEIHEDDPEHGHRATETIDRMWTKYTGNEPPYGLRDPAIQERRVLFEFRVDRLATFGKP